MTIKVKLNKYNLDISNKECALEYEKIRETAKALGHKLFAGIDAKEYNYINKLPEIQTIETKILFNNQYNTEEGFRIFDWSESININNRYLKKGYYLTGDIEALKKLKSAHYVCGYCGNRHQGHDAPLFCTKCLGSEYLKESELHLTVMQPVIGPKRESNGAPLEQFEAAQAESKKLYQEKQVQRLKDKAVQLKQKAEEEKALIDYKTQCQIEFLEAGMDIDNLIYYGQAKGWVYGWRKGVSREESEKVRSIDLSFDVKIKHDDGTSA